MFRTEKDTASPVPRSNMVPTRGIVSEGLAKFGEVGQAKKESEQSLRQRRSLGQSSVPDSAS